MSTPPPSGFRTALPQPPPARPRCWTPGRIVAATLILVAVAAASAALGAAVASRSTAGPAPTPAARASAAPAPAPVPPTTDAVKALLVAAKLPIDGWTVYTAETDTNHLLGRPNQYTAKMSWHDSRLPASLEPASLGVDDGGGVEIFANERDLVARKTYVEGLAKSPLFSEYDTVIGRFTLLRVGHRLTPDQAQAYTAALAPLG